MDGFMGWNMSKLLVFVAKLDPLQRISKASIYISTGPGAEELRRPRGSLFSGVVQKFMGWFTISKKQEKQKRK